MSGRWATWSHKIFELDKMQLDDLVVAYFTHYSIQIYIVLAIAGLGLTAFLAENVAGPLLAALAALAIYPLAEYTLHRWVLHAHWPYKSRLTAKTWKRVHYDHHQNPHDLSVLFGPLYTSLPTILIITLPLGWLVDGAAGAAAAMTTGVVIFSVYEFCHCVQHLPFTPDNRWLREIKKRHLAHHFHSERGNFGITNGLWDRVLGTFYAQMKDIERSPTTFNLGYTGAERETYPWVADLSASEDELTARRQRRRATA